MTQDEIIEMAQECNLIGMRPHLDGIYSESLVTFAHLVAAKATEEANAKANASWTLMCKKMVALEREACAKVCDELDIVGINLGGEPSPAYGYDCAKAIRDRSQTQGEEHT